MPLLKILLRQSRRTESRDDKKKKKTLRQVLLRQSAQQNGLCAAQGQQNTVVHGTFTSEQRADRIREAERPLPISRRVNGSAAPSAAPIILSREAISRPQKSVFSCRPLCTLTRKMSDKLDKCFHLRDQEGVPRHKT